MPTPPPDPSHPLRQELHALREALARAPHPAVADPAVADQADAPAPAVDHTQGNPADAAPPPGPRDRTI